MVTNSTGFSTGDAGIAAASAMYCRGKHDGGVAILANVAIGCTVDGTGTVNAPGKFLGTP